MTRKDLIFVFVKCLGLYVVATAIPSFVATSVNAWIFFSHPSSSQTAPQVMLTLQGPIIGALALIIGFQLLFNTTSMSNWIQRNDK